MNGLTPPKRLRVSIKRRAEEKKAPPVVTKTIRAPESLWARLEELADKAGGVSVNSIVVIALEKACDEEGV